MSVFSDDGGSNWSSAIQINDDGGTTSQFLPRLALDQTTGDVYAAWYDARNDAANNQLADIFAAVSVNGATSWGPNEQLTTAQSDESMNNPLRYPGNYLEYMGLAAFGGAAFVGWTDARAANFTTGNNEEIFFGRVSRAAKIADDKHHHSKHHDSKHHDGDEVVEGRRGDHGADIFVFRDNQTETASGWQQVNFATPVTYIASNHTSGNYSADANLFASAVTSGPLTAPSSGSSGGNGVYAHGTGSLFPTNNATSYGVDVLFRPQLVS